MKEPRVMIKEHRCKVLALAFASAWGMAWSSWAEPLPLETAPAGATGAPPNLILSVGDSASLGPSGLQALRGMLRSSFSADAVPDDRLRMAYQSYSSCRAQADGSCAKPLQLRTFDSTERSRFFQWLASLVPSRSHSAHLLFAEAGRFMRSTGVEGPFAAVPGQAEAPVQACRRSYHLFIDAGGWADEALAGAHAADAGPADGTRRVLPDGVVFDPYGQTEAVTRVFRDGYQPRPSLSPTPGSSPGHPGWQYNTLADFAFDHWASDLQPGLVNQVPPQLRQAGVADLGTAEAPHRVPEYWNPKNDPATWQHLSTSTIGFIPPLPGGPEVGAYALPESGPRRRPWWAATPGRAISRPWCVVRWVGATPCSLPAPMPICCAAISPH